MPIAVLPPSTAQAIGSSSILPDPCSVVKELIDNGLDASASSISVEISQNTLDVITVRDNGHGIAPADFDHVCKRAYTSKIQTLDDLRNIGGQSLGFRGVALASAADMAETLTVTTRTKNEIVASVLKYDQRGQLVSTEKASHTVGTTVCLTGFLQNIPVRRQAAVKNASKTITKLRKLLQAYAMARPATRLSFKVLNSKNDKDNWTYAPSSIANITDASRKVAGVEVAGQCVYKSWPEVVPDEEKSNAPIKLLAFLPKIDANYSKIGPSGQYISVDGRPLSSARGTAKEIIRLYKSHIRSAAKASGITSVLEPFLCLHVSCPRGSYDANVEPAKDDVLFAERDELLKLAEEFFRATYGELERDLEATEKSSAPVSGFNLLLRQPAAQEPISPPSTNHLPTVTKISRSTDEMPPANLQISTPGEDVLSEVANDESLSYDNSLNPWSIAKTHFFNSSPQSSRANQLVTPSRQSFGRRTAGRHAEAIPSSPSEISSPHTQLSSPEVSHSLPRRSSSTSLRGNHGTKGFPKASRKRDRERCGNGSLDAWFMNNNGPTLRIEQASDLLETESVMLDDFDSDELVEHSSGVVNKPFKLPRRQETREFLNRSRQSIHSPESESLDFQSPERERDTSVMEEWPSSLHRASQSQTMISNSQETERALDFERRKREANIAHREQLEDRRRYLNTPASSQPTSKSPHSNRYLAAKADLFRHRQEKQPVPLDRQKEASSSSDQVRENDPRVYLMRHQSELQKESSMPQGDNVARTATKRIPTNRLPLEKIPHGFDVHNLGLILNMPSATKSLAKQCKHIAEVDSYVSGRYAQDINVSFDSFSPLHNPGLPEICKVWESTIANLIKGKYRVEEVDLYDSSGGSDEAVLEKLDIYAAIKAMQPS